MLQTQFIRAHKESVIERLKIRNIDATAIIEEVIALDEKRRSTQASLDTVLASSNKLSKEIGVLFRNGEKEKANLLKEKTSALKTSEKELATTLKETVDQLQHALYSIPNVPNALVPEGNSEEHNLEVFKEGEIPTLANDALPHWELAKKYDIIDFELGNKVTGAGFPVYKGKGAKLQRALIAYFLDKNSEAGYTEVQPPLMVNEDSGFGTGQLPDKEGQMYHVTEDNLYLIPTAEVPVTNFLRDTLLK